MFAALLVLCLITGAYLHQVCHLIYLGWICKASLLDLILAWHAVPAGAPTALRQADLQNLMRLQASDVIGCTRLMTAKGSVGCAGLPAAVFSK